MALGVSDLAERAGLNADTVRYYERVGLLAPPRRSAAGYRLYEEAATDRLRFVKGAQRMGLRLREIRELLEIVDLGQCPCGHTAALLRQRLGEVDAELVRLGVLRAELVDVLEHQPRDAAAEVGGRWWCERAFTEGEVTAMAACPDCGCPCGERPCLSCGRR
jgi:DNA-binding transcriptional MerR regulator